MTDKDLLNLIKSRRSIRKFKDIPLKEEDLKDLIEAGVYAPTGSNTQCYRFIIITNKKDIDFLAKKKIRIVGNSKAIILVIADLSSCPYLKGKRKEILNKLPFQDCAISMGNIILLAEVKGIASCIIHLSKQWYSSEEIKKRFNLGSQYELQGLIMLGYADEKVDYETATHAGRPIKRKDIKTYILGWRK